MSLHYSVAKRLVFAMCSRLGRIGFLNRFQFSSFSNYSDIYMFADDAKFFRHIVQPHDISILQQAMLYNNGLKNGY